MDLFGNTEPTAPRVPEVMARRSLINLAHGFPEFWKAFPPTTRKVAKQQCLDKWASKECANSAQHIIQHVEWMKTQEDWTKDGGRYICAPLVYLNQQRWLDWEPQAIPVKPKIDPALAKLAQDDKNAAPMPSVVRDRLKELRRGIA